MAKPKLDFKKLLLEKGERIGVGIAGVLALVLIVLSLLLPGKGLLSGSPTEKAKGLNETAEFIKGKLADPNNKPTDADKPDKNADDRRKSLDMKAIDGTAYRMDPLIPPGSEGTLGRRVPRVFGVDDAVVKLARMQIQTYLIDDSNPPKIYALKGEKEATGPGTSAPGTAMKRPGLSNMASMLGGGGAGMGRRGNLRAPGMFNAGEDSKLDKQVVTIPLDDIDKRTDLTLVEVVRPLRMAIIAASFPYKKELDEFRAKLSLRNIGEVLAENSTKTVKGHPVPSFRFLGVEVERRELDGDNKPLGAFKPLPLRETYGPYVVLTGGRYEADDPEIKAVIFPGLVMPRLKQFNPEPAKTDKMGGPPGTLPPMMKAPDQKDPKAEAPKDHYPPVEKELATLNKTLQALRGKTAATAPTRPDRFRGIDDVFNTGNDAKDPSDGMTDTPKTGEPGTKTDPTAEEDIPDHCLVRAIDVTIEPGKTYEYRLRIIMANPNLDRRDVASPNYADKPLLDRSEWSKTPLIVQVDPELHYYAVDQKKIDGPKYTGANFMARIDEDKQVWLQSHRWIDTVPLGGQPLQVGEWTVAERFGVYRGEYAARPLRVHLPVWRYQRETFVLADDQGGRGRGTKASIMIDFGYNAGGSQPEAIVVDLHNGKRAIEKITSRTEDGKVASTAKISDESGSEVLLLNPNGRLELLEGANDDADPKRLERLKQVRERIVEVTEAGKKSSGGGDKPFGK